MQPPLESFGRIVEAIDSHTQGEPTRLVTGLGSVPGDTMAAKRDYLRDHHDEVRRALVLEPRGHDAIVLGFLTEPVSANADAGIVFANDSGYLGMCGHGTIGVATTLVRIGRVTIRGPVTEVVIDTPVGQVTAHVAVTDGLPRSVTVANVPSYVHELDRVLDVPGLGEVRADIAWGGNWFAFVHHEHVGLPVEMRHLDDLMVAARRIRGALEAGGITGVDAESGAAARIDHIKIWADETTAAGPAARALTLCPGRAYDRSPCGTGTSARLAVLHRRGEIAVGEVFTSRSILGATFSARVLGETEVAGRAAVLPEIEGTAFVTGFPRFVLDPADPLAHGPPAGG